MLQVGDLVIADDFDKPEAKNICVVVEVNQRKSFTRLKYISEDVANRYDHNHYLIFPFSAVQPTKVKDFGVDVETNRTLVIVTNADRFTTAIYDDGRARDWQGFDSSGIDIARLRKDFHTLAEHQD